MMSKAQYLAAMAKYKNREDQYFEQIQPDVQDADIDTLFDGVSGEEESGNTYINVIMSNYRTPLYTGTEFNTTTTTIETSSSMTNKDFLIIKIAYSDGTDVVMNKSFYLVPVVDEINDFSYTYSSSSYATIHGTITDSTHITFTFVNSATLTHFKVLDISGIGATESNSNEVVASSSQINSLF